jgi:pimeloyl-ACP methyl ester carboxylesterase
LLDQYFHYLRTGEGYESLRAAIVAAKSQPWGEAVDLSRVLPAPAERASWQWVATYDPRADLEALKVPTLVLVGGQDPHAPSSLTASRWEEALARADAPSSRVVVFPRAGHGITIGKHQIHGTANEYAAGYLDEVAAWVTLVNATPVPNQGH